MAQFRLDKFLADAGIGTRSQIKSYIKKGYVKVNEETVTRPETKIDSATDTICFNGEDIHMQDFEYYLLNKPAGYVSATKDNTAPTVLELIESNRKDLFPVGRLDKDTEGLLLITNDGLLSHKLLSPKRHVDKTYYAITKGIMTKEDVDAFAKGLEIGDEDLQTTLPACLEILSIDNNKDTSEVLITITEGKFHQVKRMVHFCGKEVTYLKRISFGSLILPDDLPSGSYRMLTEEEIQSLRSL
ncbi:MAG: pseudouridine synthase [Lachnospiraceae bacterium]